jgi:DEAD/DEAH box helicase domain-containing protein
MATPVFKDSLPNLLAAKDAVFHQPFVAVRLPFRVAQDMPGDFFKSIHPAHKPYVHQQRAFERLTGEDGRSTLIATGTGSGKTECFLYPILEYCYNHRGENGIKALIIYPMNALATDQAKRIAQLIYDSPKLRGNVTAGMYVGGHESHPSRAMGPHSIITDHETMLTSPPDILLTNYKMLDYLLVRPKDAALWNDNRPGTLKYVAVDEMHTFDGAQGTDLACLLRRLKSRLYAPSDYLCCIGTSATMGSKDSAEGILKYAESVFGEPFEPNAVVTEDRLTAPEFFEGSAPTDFTVPSEEAMRALNDAVESGDQTKFLAAAARAWLNDGFAYTDIMGIEARLALGSHLMRHAFTQDLLAHSAGNYVQNETVCESLGGVYPELRGAAGANLALDALYALISHARAGGADVPRPFLFVQVHLWLKELRRLLAKVSAADITYALSKDLNEQQAATYLPVVNCRDCGETGWVSITNERGNVKITNLEAFYNKYFRHNDQVVMLYPNDHKKIPPGADQAFICPSCLQLDIGNGEKRNCSCGSERVPVICPTKYEPAEKDARGFKCPHCGSQAGLSIMGVRSATAISASISQLLASKFNDDKKTLAFSDNVQDAAHRAGFFNARSWKPGLRSAIQKFVPQGGNGLCLREFMDGFVAHWRKKLSSEEFVSRFTAPNLAWMRAYENMKKNGKFGVGQDEKQLMHHIEYRLGYEIMLEYGLYRRIGRTLEKSGCSVLSFPQGDVAAVIKRSLERAINDIGGAKGRFSEGVFGQMAIGFLNLMASNGAFGHIVFNEYTKSGGNAYLLANKHEKWLPGLQTGRNTPRFVYQATELARKRLAAFDALKKNDAYCNWINRCMGGFENEPSECETIAKIVLEECIRQGLVVSMPSSAEYKIWALSRDKAIISAKVAQFVCGECGQKHFAGIENAALWDGAPCPRKQCMGKLHMRGDAGLGYFGKLYSGGDMVRVEAKEHTGLLERDDREELERVFKRGNDRMPWDANVLSCTPTLELGIDIGDLSSVILCSVPPGQAQYLQRTGRAGRKDGNALNMAVANAKPHDLYFYADPMEMMAGKVEPPKIFLQASAVLERQFFAYCMDSWVKKGAPESAIPKDISPCLNNLVARDSAKFPFNLLAYVQGNVSGLLRTFIQMFPELEDSEKSDLERYAKGSASSEKPEKLENPMHLKILNAFESLKEQRDSLSKSVKQLRDMIKDLEGKTKDSSYDAEIKELKAERAALEGVVRSINNKNVWGFLSDEGLLPNYAFPESGVILKAVLKRREEPTDGAAEPPKKKSETMVYEYSRSASAAIAEFAPSNNFYAGGRKLRINQVDLISAQTAKWRLCPNCPHAQLDETGKDVAACPECGSPAWADQGQARSMLKVQMVYSNVDYAESLIGDESDDRQTTFYCKQMLVDVDEDKDIFTAHRMDNDDFAFGYEFVKKATLREINFGESGVGEQLTVAGHEDFRKGFKICKHCGKLQPERGVPEHSYACKAKNAAGGSAEAYEEYLFIYREFATEALRILIPATTADSTKVKLESFVAAFMLGMKEYFGNVDHLRATISEVPVLDSDYRKQYLVIYDSVPGGTGYLKQLTQKKHSLTEIFEKALAAIEKCGCKEDAQKDGCYRCLFAYRQSRNIGQISRKAAIHLLEQILSGKDNLTEIPKLGAVPVNKLFESELERLFIETLEQMGNQFPNLKVNKVLVRNKEGWLLTIGESIWEIEPQVTLDAANGVDVKTRADFVLWPTKPKGGQKPVAIYTDGFMFHKDKAADDTLKREAIRRSGNFRVWSLTWKDVQCMLKPQGDYATHTLESSKMPYGPAMYNPSVQAAGADNLKPAETPPMKLLLHYLENPDAERIFAAHAKAYALSLLQPGEMENRGGFDAWNMNVCKITDMLGLDAPTHKFGESIFGVWKPRETHAHIAIYAGVAKEDLKIKRSGEDALVCCVLDDEEQNRTDKYESEWNGFWHFFNIMQFLKRFTAVSASGLNAEMYGKIHWTAPADVEAARPGADSGWLPEILRQLSDEGAKAFAAKCFEIGASKPIAGYELVGEDGTVVGEAEMAWEAPKVALLLDEQSKCIDAFAARGWKTLGLDDDIQAGWFDADVQ